jgi:hypothetical protein
VVCSAVWLLTIALIFPVLFFIGYGMDIIGCILMIIDSEVVRDLMFFGGAVFLALHLGETRKSI